MGNSKGSTAVILETLGVKSVEELMDQVVPASIRLTPETRFKHNGMKLEGIDSEMIMLERMRQLSDNNIINKSFIGQGYYGTNTPSVIRRNVLENPRWYTPYTPYQAEIAQGRLESLLNFQTAIMEITEMDVSNASLLDEATAAAEAVQMSYNFHNGKRNKYFVSNSLFPQTIEVIKTKCHAIGIELEIGDTTSFNFENAKQYSGMIVQTPDNFGSVHDYTDLGVKIKESGMIFTIVSDILGNCIMKTPGAQGADIACGSAQRMGIPMAYGGPHPGYFASCDKLKRKLPGRIIGISKDAHGNQAFRMALQTREQHIRRDKATSNICTAQALLANMASFYMQWHGQYGLKKMATKARFMSQIFMQELDKIGINFQTDKNNYFDTVCINVKESGFTSPDWVLAQFHKYGINIRKVDANRVSLSFDEITSLYDLDEVIEIFYSLKKNSYHGKHAESDFEEYYDKIY
jgi:glycine dehydrogenase